MKIECGDFVIDIDSTYLKDETIQRIIITIDYMMSHRYAKAKDMQGILGIDKNKLDILMNTIDKTIIMSNGVRYVVGENDIENKKHYEYCLERTR